MIRINLVLLAAVLVSAFYLVHTQYESRRVYTQLDRAQAQARRIEVEHEQLRVLRQAQSTSAKVQQVATKQLQMRAVTPGITEYVTAPVPASGAPSAGAQP